MSHSETDLTFFTNDENQTLLDRFKRTLADTRFFDILVGYFHSSGFHQLYDSIEAVDKTRILVGLGIDADTWRAVAGSRLQFGLDLQSHKVAKETFEANLLRQIDESEEADDKLELGLKKFIAFLQTDCPDADDDRARGGSGRKLEIRAFPSRDLHAKVYIGRFAPYDRDFGFVVTGSSNFSYSGLVANREFNVELRDRRDVEFALAQFEGLWQDSVDISELFIDAVQEKTWLNDTITPYELYLKLIYEYMREDINMQDNMEIYLPEGFMELDYQRQAVQQAIKKINEYNGVFLADVVGLGKTFIAAQILQQIKDRTLVICPPVLQAYWETSLHDFNVNAKVESLGRLDNIIQFGIDRFDTIVVDEAHRFRNEQTQAYSDLFDICQGKKVILVTATPLNNTTDDILAQLKLFQAPRNSTIPGIPDLTRFFRTLRRRLDDIDRSDPEYKIAIKGVSREIRERILKHVMVRRTRADVMRWFKEDTQKQGFSFPEVQKPSRILYEFEGKMEGVFNQTIDLLRQFRYARYVPLSYYSGKQLSEFDLQQQRNIGGFMKSILVKRLESSFHAFRRTIRRFIESYEQFIAMFAAGTVYISKKVDVYELLANDDLDVLEQLVAEEKAQRYQSKDFRRDFPADLDHDLGILKSIEALWSGVDEDPKRDALVRKLKQSSDLKQRRLVIFTESQETGSYLFEQLNQCYPKQVIFFSSRGGQTGSPTVTHTPATAREVIQSAFDPNQRKNRDDLRILITTDVLAEGINLHRASALINYDLPWNPTRVLQRVGRINRLGADHDKVLIYNFFPTSHADEHLGLEANITNKIQIFHNLLGEDAKYLSDGEEIGSQQLFDTLNSKSAYTGEDEHDPELEYLHMMRQLRDENPALFKTVQNLPRKARSGRQVESLPTDQLVTFFRRGALKKFYLNQGDESREITFFDAAKLMECKPDTPRHSIPGDYHKWLDINKQRFREDASQDDEPAATGGGRSNTSYIDKRLRERSFRDCPKFTDSDKELVRAVRRTISQGLVPSRTARTIKRAFEGTLEPLEMLAILRQHVRTLAPQQAGGRQAAAKREVILSAWQIAHRPPKTG